MAILDLRRRDVRSNTLVNPWWMTSAEIDKDADDDDALLFVQRSTEGIIYIHEVVVEIITAFAGGTVSLNVGYCTIATPSITTGGSVSDNTTDTYIQNADLTLGTAGQYITSGSTWFTNKIAGTETAQILVGADTTVPCIYATLTSTDTITAGVARVHVMCSKLPKKG